MLPTIRDAKPKRTFEVVRDDRQTGWYDPGYGVLNEATGVLVNDEPFATEAQANRVSGAA